MLWKLVSLLGILLIIGFAWLLSQNRKLFPWRTVLWGLALQFLLALIILKTRIGLAAFKGAQAAVTKLIDLSMEGPRMIFGPLANSQLLEETWGAGNGVALAITIMATIIVVSSLSSLLYHWGVLQRAVHAMAFVMRKVMRTSGSESLSVAGNIFMGQTEAPLLIKPYLAGMTRSELLTLMTGGMATIAGGVLAVYVSLGVSSGHLLTASVLSAPGALLIAKIMLPETEKSETAHDAPLRIERTTTNSIDALCRGASDGMALSINVIAMLIAFIAIVAMVNFLLGAVFQPFGLELTLEQLFGWANAPFALLMGIPPRDCVMVGQMLGERIVLNEFVAYLSLTQNREVLEERSFIIATYALCGFANFGSVAIQIGGIGVLAPDRRKDLAALGLRAMAGGLLACYLTASLIGLFA